MSVLTGIWKLYGTGSGSSATDEHEPAITNILLVHSLLLLDLGITPYHLRCALELAMEVSELAGTRTGKC